MASKLRFEVATPLEYFALLVGDESSLPLIEAAASLGQDAQPGLDVQGVLAEIDTLAKRLQRRVAADAVPLHRLRMLNRYFFQDLGFAGNVNHFDDPRNSYLHEVLRTRRGIPISLAVLYIELAQHIGLAAKGVSFPGHFLVKLRLRQGQRQGEVLIDPVSGRSLSRDELDQMLEPYRRRTARGGGNDEIPLALYLQQASEREVLARMLRNLKRIHRAEEDWPALLAVQRRLVVLLPFDGEERRDRGLAYAELGCLREAADDLAAYLERQPGAGDAREIGLRLAALRRARPG